MVFFRRLERVSAPDSLGQRLSSPGSWVPSFARSPCFAGGMEIIYEAQPGSSVAVNGSLPRFVAGRFCEGENASRRGGAGVWIMDDPLFGIDLGPLPVSAFSLPEKIMVAELTGNNSLCADF